MAENDPLPLAYSWPLFDAAHRMELRRLLALGVDEAAVIRALGMDGQGPTADRPTDGGIGLWSCNLATEELRWSPAVHSLFGLPLDETPSRSFALARYGSRSRSSMEQLRQHAIRHKRGFTVDALIRRDDGEAHWMRLSAMPVIEGGKPVRLIGTKQDVTVHYDGPGWRKV